MSSQPEDARESTRDSDPTAFQHTGSPNPSGEPGADPPSAPMGPSYQLEESDPNSDEFPSSAAHDETLIDDSSIKADHIIGTGIEPCGVTSFEPEPTAAFGTPLHADRPTTPKLPERSSRGPTDAGEETLADVNRTLADPDLATPIHGDQTLSMEGISSKPRSTLAPINEATQAFGTHPSKPNQADLGPTASYTPMPHIQHEGALHPHDSHGSWGTLPADGRMEPGKVLFGRYLIRRRIGRGGMGEVWLVRDLTLDADRVLKTISANIASNPEARSRLVREARAGANVDHENAVRVHDIVLIDEFAFIVMEYVRGESLDKQIQPGVPRPLEWVANVLRQLCEVLHVAHDKGIVHRDLKPSNLMMLEGRNHLKVLDFGIAKILGANDFEGDAHTMTNAVMGTPPYMSPEQAEGHSPVLPDGRADGRGDLYSVGVILYEFLTGRQPFVGSSAKKIAETLTSIPPAFAEVNPSVLVPPGIEQLVLRCLEKDPSKRPQSARELYEEFASALPAHVATYVAAPAKSRRRIGLGFELLAGILLLGFIGYALVPGPEPQPVDPRPDNPEFEGRTESTPKFVTSIPVGFRPESVQTQDGQARYEFVRADDRSSVRLVPRWLDSTTGDGEPSGLKLKSASGELQSTFQLVRGGSFHPGLISSESTAASPTTDIPSLYVQTTEVTNGDFRRFLDEVPSVRATAGEFERAANELLAELNDSDEVDRHPAVGVSHGLAERFAAWAGGRLPTSYEWEYIARSRGRDDRPFVWGTGPAPEPDTDQARIDSITKPGPPTSTVGYYGDDRTEQGIYDLTGNVREWTSTRDPNLAVMSRPGESIHVVRGGSWKSNSAKFSTTDEEFLLANETLRDVGFRVVYEINRAEAPADDTRAGFAE